MTCGSADGETIESSELVCPLTITAEADGGTEYVDPDITMAGDPGASVWLPMMKCEALFAVTCCEPTVITGIGLAVTSVACGLLVAPFVMGLNGLAVGVSWAAGVVLTVGSS